MQTIGDTAFYKIETVNKLEIRANAADIFSNYESTSGSPAIDVASDRIPESTIAEKTYRQSISEITAAVEHIAMNVWAIVFKARIPAARIHARGFVFTCIVIFI